METGIWYDLKGVQITANSASHCEFFAGGRMFDLQWTRSFVELNSTRTGRTLGQLRLWNAHQTLEVVMTCSTEVGCAETEREFVANVKKRKPLFNKVTISILF